MKAGYITNGKRNGREQYLYRGDINAKDLRQEEEMYIQGTKRMLKRIEQTAKEEGGELDKIRLDEKCKGRTMQSLRSQYRVWTLFCK